MAHQIPFPSPVVPILGQPFTVTCGFPTLVLQCQCAAKTTVLLMAGTPGSCRACGRAYVIARCAFNLQTGQIQAEIGLVTSAHAQPANGDASEGA